MTVVDDVVQEIFDELYNNGQHDDIAHEDTDKWDDLIKQEIDYVVDSADEQHIELLVVHYASCHPGWLTCGLKPSYDNNGRVVADGRLNGTTPLSILLYDLLTEEMERCRLY